ncbi:MAG TPA: 5'/3'-nucleotidase SurE [Nocardioidaceae bacterium]|nr:5'/3'-nucleotidase SurE [Nocardioidaceae bacterium]
MRALITNDDGIESKGLHTLAQVAVDAGLEVVVAAPHEERSGASASLVATRSDGRLLVQKAAIGLDVPTYAVEASPAYIAWAAVRGAFGPRPHLVLSGINKGPNTGHAVLHSGTVGAALTANAHGLPALAVSVSAPDPVHWETTASVADRALRWLLEREPRPVLNVNVPDVPLDQLRGLRRAPLATFGAVQADIAEVGEGFVTLTFSEVDVTGEPESDAALQQAGWATITPLSGPAEARECRVDGLVDPA